MAEIEFQRRGTPLWIVVVALLALLTVAWFFFLRPRTANAPTAATPVTADSMPVGTPGGAGAATTPGNAPGATTVPPADSARADSARPDTSVPPR